jgi:hypothetical protein
MMNYKVFGKLLGLVVIILSLGSCSGIKVTSDYDKSVDFTQFKTFEYYGWAEESDKLLNDLDKSRFEKAFAEEFNKRGLTYVESGGDLIVTLFIVVEQKSETVANTTNMGGYYGGYYGRYYGYGPGYGWGPGYSTTTVNTYDYNVGTLVCDVFDKSNEKLIWEGIGAGTVDDDPSSREENIPKAVAKIMATYPVQPVK